MDTVECAGETSENVFLSYRTPGENTKSYILKYRQTARDVPALPFMLQSKDADRTGRLLERILN